MAILTIARELGSICGGEELALCNALNLHCINKATLEDRFRELGVERSVLERFDECNPGFTGILSSDSVLYWESLQTVLLKELIDDNIAIIGRGGNFLLKNLVDCFRIRLIAPMDFRINLLCTERSCSEDEARKAIRQSDSAREKFCRYYYGAEWKDPLGYDLVVNTAELPLDKLAVVLPSLLPASSTGNRHPQLLRAVQEQIIRQKLYASDEFQLYSLEVKCPTENSVVLRGCVHSEEVAEKAVAVARSVPGVTEVKNELSVVYFEFTHPMW